MMDHTYQSVEMTWSSANSNLEEYDYQNEIDDDLEAKENAGDDFLIDLYRERKFLYDKADKSFKDSALKENAWCEMSKIMTDKNFGEYYTPEFCKKRIRTLREKYSRMLKSNYLRSGSAAITTKKSPLLKQFSFLQAYILRRRTFSNVKSLREITKVQNNLENLPGSSRLPDIPDNSENIIGNVQLSNNISQARKKTEENKNIKTAIKRKTDEEEIFGAISTLTNILSSDSAQDKGESAECAFGKYVAIELEKYDEQERSIKKQKIMQVLFTPVDKM